LLILIEIEETSTFSNFYPSHSTPGKHNMKLAALSFPIPTTNFFVFGYGSLMWNPGFPYKNSFIATVRGFNRKFCLRSQSYRGTPECKGLVLGLDHGGSCKGMAFEVCVTTAEEVIEYLFDRELERESYVPTWVDIDVNGKPGKALTFVINRDGQDYAPALSKEEQVITIRKATGSRGSNFEYLENTIKQLDDLSIKDESLLQLYHSISHLEN
jgi:cation transport protein ChaC